VSSESMQPFAQTSVLRRWMLLVSTAVPFFKSCGGKRYPLDPLECLFLWQTTPK
jgi:hypothetical protein